MMRSDSLPPTATASKEGAGFPRWYCLHCQPKHEHIAASRLRKIDGVQAYCPRIRFKRARSTGTAWVTEAMFPNYIFARFDFAALNRQVKYSQGVRNILQFGANYAAIDDAVIEDLKMQTDASEIVVAEYHVGPGDGVRIVEGAFKGLDAVVTQVLPARERVKILLEFLGRTIEAEIREPGVLANISHPLAA